MSDRVTLFDLVGGTPFFEALAARFYERVVEDPVLLRLYPEPEDLVPARRKLALFLAQYWGGPPAYSEERGHPRLGMRHAPFGIGSEERDRWLRHMRGAVVDLAPSQEIERALLGYFDMAAEGLRNRD